MNGKVVGGSLMLLSLISYSLSEFSITGGIVGTNYSSFFVLVSMIVFVFGFLVFVGFMGSEQRAYRERKSKLEGIMGSEKFEGLSEEEKEAFNKSIRRYEKRLAKNSGGKEGLWEVYISRDALERMSKDKHIRDNIAAYLLEIDKIARDPKNRGKVERIGDFNVSPRSGGKGGAVRVAWHLGKNEKAVFIDDLLYHTHQRVYVGRWNKRVSQGNVRRKDYEDKGYEPYDPNKIA